MLFNCDKVLHLRCKNTNKLFQSVIIFCVASCFLHPVKNKLKFSLCRKQIPLLSVPLFKLLLLFKAYFICAFVYINGTMSYPQTISIKTEKNFVGDEGQCSCYYST